MIVAGYREMIAGAASLEMLARRIDALPQEERSNTLANMPAHLDRAADERSARCLIRLALDGFPRLKAERTLDTPLSSLDYRYYFRATLRNCDLGAALEIAQSRKGLSQMANWLVSGVLAGVLPHLDAQSKLWQHTQRALSALQPVTERMQRLAEFHQPGLEPAMYSWMRDQFERYGGSASASVQRAFLKEVAEHERGAIEYVLRHAARVQPSAELITAVLSNLPALCEGASRSVQEVLDQTATLISGHDETLAAAADTVARMSDRATASMALSRLQLILPAEDHSALPLMCAAALSHAWMKHEDFAKAESALRNALRLVPPVLGDTAIRELHKESYVDAAGHLALAAAPFARRADLWTQSIAVADELAGRATALLHKSKAIVHFLRATAWITDPEIRITWLDNALKAARDLTTADLNPDTLDPLDRTLRINRTLTGESPRRRLCEPILQAILEILADIDRILPSPGDLQPLVSLITAAASIASSFEKRTDRVYAFYRRVMPALAPSRNIHVHCTALESFFQLTADRPDEQAAGILEAGIAGLLRTNDEPGIQDLFADFLVHADRVWCRHNASMRPLLAFAGLNAAVRLKQSAALDVVANWSREWIDEADPKDRSWFRVMLSAVVMALGRNAEAERELAGVHDLDAALRLQIARVLLEGGERERAASLVEPDCPLTVRLEQSNELETILGAAGLIVQANGSSRARQTLVDAARQYRAKAGELPDDLEPVILTAVAGLGDEATVLAFVAEAESELLQATEPDAAQAARWYAALALSAAGEVQAARSAWSGISSWAGYRRMERRMEWFRGELVTAHDTTQSDGGSLRRIEEALISLRDPELCKRALEHICRAMPSLPEPLTRRLPDIVVRTAAGLKRRWRDAVLAALCEAGKQLRLTDSAVHIAAAVAYHIMGRKLPASSGDPEKVLRPLTELIQAIPGPSRELVRALMERLAHPVAGRFEAELFEVAVEQDGDLLHAQDLCERVSDQGDRLLFLRAVANASRKSRSVPTDKIMLALMDHREGVDKKLIYLARLYRDFRLTASPSIIVELENRIRKGGPPGSPASVVRWALDLAGTPLEALCRPPLQELWAHLDLFANSTDDLHSLSAFLTLESREGIHQCVQRFQTVIQWATHMPPVNNEDWRLTAFTSILEAATALPRPDRDAVQKLALQTALDSLTGGDSCMNILRSALPAPIGAEVADWAIAACFARRGGGTSDPGILQDLLLRTMEFDAHCVNADVLDACLRILQGAAGTDAVSNRTLAAKVACESSHPGLRTWLSERLLHAYEFGGLSELDYWELVFLGTMPFEWWLEHCMEITLKQVKRSELVKWVDGIAKVAPERAWCCVVLACDWLTRGAPDEIEDLWFELCTVPAGLPAGVRQAVAAMLKRSVIEGAST